jgi:catechol 2,3-dioxygenase-like lactoylglutathione lyase family enzyme
MSSTRVFSMALCLVVLSLVFVAQGKSEQSENDTPGAGNQVEVKTDKFSNVTTVNRNQHGGAKMFSRIMYVTVFVSDQDKALDFYTSSFGFQKHADYKGPEGRFLTIALKDQGFEVLLWPGSAGQAKAAPGVGTLFIESEDLRKDFAELKARGVKFLEPEPETYPFGMRVTALDPDGNPVALRQRRK